MGSTSTLSSPPSRLPDSSTFDILPALHSLLYRCTLDPADKDVLTHKDLATEAAAVKLKVRRVRAVIDNLPDIGRMIEDQEKEMSMLERRVLKQRVVLQGLAQQARNTMSNSS